MVIQGDCLIELKVIADKSIDLVYLDPPFFTQKKQSLKTRDNLKEYFFDDTWEDMNEYKTFIQDRLIECKRVLKETARFFRAPRSDIDDIENPRERRLKGDQGLTTFLKPDQYEA